MRLFSLQIPVDERPSGEIIAGDMGKGGGLAAVENILVGLDEACHHAQIVCDEPRGEEILRRLRGRQKSKGKKKSLGARIVFQTTVPKLCVKIEVSKQEKSEDGLFYRLHLSMRPCPSEDAAPEPCADAQSVPDLGGLGIELRKIFGDALELRNGNGLALYSFPTERYANTLGLPADGKDLPGVKELSLGTPRLVGLDIEYEDSPLGLRRSYVCQTPGGEYAVKMLYKQSFPINQLPQALLVYLDKLRKIFVRSAG